MDSHKGITRRTVLIGAGAAIGAIGGGVIWRAVSQGVFSIDTGPAYQAWQDWNLTGPDNLNLVRAAILSSNAHDSQPWLFQLGRNTIDLYADTTRNLGAIDPVRREMVISLGCALENLMLATQAMGLVPTLTLMPDAADQTHVAHIDLSMGQPNISPLYTAIPNRHTNRSPYDTGRPFAPSTLAALEGLIDMPEVKVLWITSDADRKSFADLTVRATEAFIADAQQAQDDFSWYRNDWQQLQAHKDGITIDASGLPPLTAAAAKILPVTQAQDEQGWVSNTRTQTATAAAFGVLMVQNKLDYGQSIMAGRIWQRMSLWATTQGVAMQPLNQTVERVDREQSAGLAPEFTQALSVLQPAGWQMVFPFRLGFPTQIALPSPRRPADQVLVKPRI